MESTFDRENSTSVLPGVVIGLVGGAIGCFVMNQFQSLLHRTFNEPSRGFRKDEKTESVSEVPANEKAAKVVVENVLHRGHLKVDERKTAGQLVHYLFGSSMGALYGGIIATQGIRQFGSGLAFGTALWAIADELLVPLMKLSSPSTRYPLKTHLYALSSHLIYGLTLDGVRMLGDELSERGVSIPRISGVESDTTTQAA